ncbi:hypothetical protein HZS_3139, partial [Henneguya salminicola]
YYNFICVMIQNVPSYTDSQTGYVYKIIIDDVLKNVRKEIREEVDDHTLNILKQNWERRLSNVIARSKDQACYTAHPHKNVSSAPTSMAFTVNSMPQLPKVNPVFYNVNPNTDVIIPDNSFKRNLMVNDIRTTKPDQNNEVYFKSFEKRKQPSEPSKPTYQERLSTNHFEDSNSKNEQAPDNIQPATKKPKVSRVVQLDGGVDDLTDTEDEDLYSDEDVTADSKAADRKKRVKLENDYVEIDDEGNFILFDQAQGDNKKYEQLADVEPLNPEDDISDEDCSANNTENIMICRFEKLVRRKAVWKIELRYGIASINGVDLVFNKAVGDI